MNQTEKIRALPEYIALTQARKKIVWPLSAAVMLVYFSLVVTIAFAPQSLGKPVGDGVTSIGVVLGLGVIFFCLLVTGIYVFYANRVIEPLTKTITQKARALK
jgi:uncharacterized membrane protein (DUF485 family)